MDLAEIRDNGLVGVQNVYAEHEHLFLFGFLGIVIVWAIHHFILAPEAKKEEEWKGKVSDLAQNLAEDGVIKNPNFEYKRGDTGFTKNDNTQIWDHTKNEYKNITTKKERREFGEEEEE